MAHARLVVALFLLVTSMPVGAQESDAPAIALLVAGPDPTNRHAHYGHAALLVQNDNQTELAYTYIVYTPDDAWSVVPLTAMGHAVMELREASAGVLIHAYEEQGREVRRTPLQLSDDEARTLAGQLKAISEQEGPVPYDMVADNCSTRIRDLLNALVGGRLQDAIPDADGPSVRMRALPYMDHELMEAPYWLFLSGSAVDQPLSTWDAMFLPLELEASLGTPIPEGNNATRTLTADTVIVTPSTYPETRDGPWWLGLAVLSLGVVLLTAAGVTAVRMNETRGRRIVALTLIAIGLAVGLYSIVLLLAWFNQLGPYAAANQNILVASPFAFLLVMVGGELWSTSFRAWRNAAGLCLLSLLLLALAVVIRWIPGVPAQNNLPFIAFAAFAWICLFLVAAAATSLPVLMRRSGTR